MAIEQPKLKYAEDALAPAISKETVKLHYGFHTKKYFDTVNELVDGTIYDHKGLDELITKDTKSTMGSKLFNNACQAYNHAFFWNTLCSPADSEKSAPSDELLEQIKDDFETLAKFKDKFSESATSHFGSGWTWLVWTNGKLLVKSLPNGGCPLAAANEQPLLVLDLWEHAYYLDYHGERAKYVKNFWNIVDWNTVNRAFVKAKKAK